MAGGPPQGEQLGAASRGLGIRGGSGFNTRCLGVTHLKELGHNRSLPGGHTLVAESWEGLGCSGGGAGQPLYKYSGILTASVEVPVHTG